MHFAMFPVNLSKLLRLPQKSDARSYEVLHLSRKSPQQTWRSDENMSLVLHLPRKMHLCRSSSNVQRLPSFLEMLQNPHVLLTLDNVHNPVRLPRETTSQLPKVLRTWCALYILTSKCDSRHNSVHFFDISTSKSVPNMVCFVHFDFEMCYAPQRRALFRHRNFQKWSEPVLSSTFWLRHVLRATTACNFSSLVWSDSSAPAALASLLFDPPETQIIGKTQCFATLPFSRTCIFFLLTLSLLSSSLFCSSLLFSSLTLTTSSFHLSILSEVWLLNFLR